MNSAGIGEKRVEERQTERPDDCLERALSKIFGDHWRRISRSIGVDDANPTHPVILAQASPQLPTSLQKPSDCGILRTTQENLQIAKYLYFGIYL